MRVLSLFYWMLTKKVSQVFVVIVTLIDRILNDGLQKRQDGIGGSHLAPRKK